MSVLKIIEVTASSDKSFDDAVIQCVEEMSKTIHKIDSICIKDLNMHVRNGKPVLYRNCV